MKSRSNRLLTHAASTTHEKQRMTTPSLRRHPLKNSRLMKFAFTAIKGVNQH
jgi:hypothetical protein